MTLASHAVRDLRPSPARRFRDSIDFTGSSPIDAPEAALFKRQKSSCHRCGAVLLQTAEVCSTCCAPQGLSTSQAPAVTEPQPVVTAVEAPAPQTGLGAWPFGQADAEAAAQVAARTVTYDVRKELSHYSAQSSTHTLSGIPVQRAAQPLEEMQSVPSVGPNPFLAAARIQDAQEEVAAVEGYRV